MLWIGNLLLFISSLLFSNLLSLPKASPEWELTHVDSARYELSYFFGAVIAIVSVIVFAICWERFIKLNIASKIINVTWMIVNIFIIILAYDDGDVSIKYHLTNLLFKDHEWYGYILSTLLLIIVSVSYKYERIRDEITNKVKK